DLDRRKNVAAVTAGSKGNGKVGPFIRQDHLGAGDHGPGLVLNGPLNRPRVRLGMKGRTRQKEDGRDYQGQKENAQEKTMSCIVSSSSTPPHGNAAGQLRNSDVMNIGQFGRGITLRSRKSFLGPLLAHSYRTETRTVGRFSSR